MSDAEDRAAALILLNDWADPDVNPKLTPDQLAAILDRHKVATTWVAGLTVKSSELIQPTAGNGRWYRVVKPGILTTEPAWSGSVSDGGVTFEDAGEADLSVYDVRAAAWEAWDKKARMSSKYPTMAGTNVASIHDHCVAMRDSFAPALAA